MAIDDKLRITREQYSKFIEDHDTIKQFERLIDFANNAESSIQDIAHPIGEIFIQYPGKEDPNALYPGQTWNNISTEYAGDFFRAEGGDAEIFESGEQGHQFQGHEHSYNWGNNSGGGRDGAQNPVTRANNVGSDTVAIITDGVNGAPSVGSETRPVNHTIRVWERTA